MKILLVEDDERISDAIAEEISDQNYAVETAYDGEEAWGLMEAFTYDLILLDVMLPKIDGLELCRKLRATGNSTPVLMLTARDTTNDKVLGLDAGADDYLVKPFELQELLARVRALMRRNNQTLSPILEWGDLRIDTNTCEVFYQDKPLQLRPKEYRLLELFVRNNRRIFSRAQILEQLWSYEEVPEEATVKAHIRSLRQKLLAGGAPDDLIETVYGMGYRLKEQGSNHD